MLTVCTALVGDEGHGGATGVWLCRAGRKAVGSIRAPRSEHVEF